jgi:hypothetical protein
VYPNSMLNNKPTVVVVDVVFDVVVLVQLGIVRRRIVSFMVFGKSFLGYFWIHPTPVEVKPQWSGCLL